MSNPFGTSLRRDPADPRGLRARIDALILERLEDAIDSACLDLLVELRRERNLPLPVADSAEDRTEFHGLAAAFLERLAVAITSRLTAEQRARLSPARPEEGDEARRLIALQVSLSKLVPDYWQQFEAVKAELRGLLSGT